METKTRNTVRFLLFVLFMGSLGPLRAQSGLQDLRDARSLAMAGISMNAPGIQALFTNPAGLAQTENLSAVAVAEIPFAIAELQRGGIGAVLPAQNGAWGLQVGSFGFEGFSELSLGLNYARQLTEGFRLGARIMYWNTRIPEYGNRGLLTFALGIQAQLSPGISLGAMVYNPIRQPINENESTYSILALGLNYQISDALNLAVEAEKDIDFPLRIKAGLEYQIAEPIWLRFGVQQEPSLVTGGLGFQILPHMTLDVSVSRHPVLGITPGIGWVYQQR